MLVDRKLLVTCCVCCSLYKFIAAFNFVVQPHEIKDIHTELMILKSSCYIHVTRSLQNPIFFALAEKLENLYQTVVTLKEKLLNINENSPTAPVLMKTCFP